MSKREESADSGACVFVRIMRARGLSVQDGDLKSTFKAIEEYKMTPTTRDPSCLCQVTSGRLEGATGVCEHASSPQWDHLVMFPYDNVRAGRSVDFKVVDVGGVFEVELGQCSVALDDAALAELPTSSESEKAPRLLALVPATMALADGPNAEGMDVSSIMALGNDVERKMKTIVTAEDAEETLEVAMWRGNRNDADAKAAFLGTKRKAPVDWFRDTAKTMLCAADFEETRGHGTTVMGGLVDLPPVSDPFKTGLGEGDAPRKDRKKGPRCVRYTECHTAVLRVQTLDCRWLRDLDYSARPYVELCLGDRVVAPSRGRTELDEDGWMVEDFSMLLTQPYCKEPLTLRIRNAPLMSDLGLGEDEILGQIDIPLVLEAPGKLPEPSKKAGDEEEDAVKEFRLAYNPGKGLCENATIAHTKWLQLNARKKISDKADEVNDALHSPTAAVQRKRAGSGAPGSDDEDAKPQKRESSRRAAVVQNKSKSRWGLGGAKSTAGEVVGDLKVRAWIDEGYFHRDNDSIAQITVKLGEATFKKKGVLESDILKDAMAGGKRKGAFGAVGDRCDPYAVLRISPHWATLDPRQRKEDTKDGYAKFDWGGGEVQLGVVDPFNMLTIAFYDGANKHAPLGKVKVRAASLASTGFEYRKKAPLIVGTDKGSNARVIGDVDVSICMTTKSQWFLLLQYLGPAKAVGEDVLKSDTHSWGVDNSEATHDWGKSLSADLRKMKVAAMRLKDVMMIYGNVATETFEIYHWRPHSRTAIVATVMLWLIYYPKWIWTFIFCGFFYSTARNFSCRRKTQLDSIGVDLELSKGSFVKAHEPSRDRDATLQTLTESEVEPDEYDELDPLTSFKRQYSDFVETLVMVEYVFNECATVLEQGVGIFTWGDERITGFLTFAFFMCVFVPVAFVPPPAFYKGFFTFPYLVAMYPPCLDPAQPINDYPGRVANVLNRVPARHERIL
ncbi:hypothetical protein SO694_00116065 [Aureococcus anophagefferens]|uniref:C2 domain-containing protein n=1 Tax=Aureococcus anophagefferens TaxID=44056 RepID=A0ABR1FWM2_AURAN